MIILNFSYPLTPSQLASIEQLSEKNVERVVDVKTQFDHTQPFAEQARVLIESIGLTSQQWQSEPLLINLPSFNVIAALLLAELHGRMGHFPAAIRFRRIGEGGLTQFEPAEILNLQTVRDAARGRR